MERKTRDLWRVLEEKTKADEERFRHLRNLCGEPHRLWEARRRQEWSAYDV